MMVGCVAVIIGAIVQAASYSTAQIIVGRLVTGKERYAVIDRIRDLLAI